MLVGLHDAEMDHLKGKTFPNYALMKLAAYHKARGDIVGWWFPLKNYGLVYSSKVFDFTPLNPYLPDKVVKGGTGYDVATELPPEVDAMFPDYSVYPSCDYAVGFITRGCPRRCPWCIVPEKEGDVRPYREWKQLVRSDTNKLVLMDNNILASEFGIEQLESLIDSGYRIYLNQGLDARLVDEHVADVLARLDWIRFIRFSCDTRGQLDAVLKAARLLKARGVRPYNLFVYLLVTNDLEDAAYRVERLRGLKGINLDAQAERNSSKGIVPSRLQLEFTQRYVYSGVYRQETWDEYCRKRHIRKNGSIEAG